MQPVQIVAARGKSHHLTKEEYARRRAAEPDAPPGMRGADPPAWLAAHPALRERFEMYAAMLGAVVPGLFCQLDAELLAQHVVWEEQFERLTDMALSCDDPDDLARLQQMQNRAYQNSKSSASLMGLTLTDRCRLAVPEPAGDGDGREGYNV